MSSHSTVLCSLTLLMFFRLLLVDAAVTLPNPLGPYSVGLSISKLTDDSRVDPFSPDHQLRSVMISAFYPVGPNNHCDSNVVEYMPPATAAIEDQYYSQYGLPNGTFETLRLSLCNGDPSMTKTFLDYPLIIFSPGLGNSRLEYSLIAESVASFGYVVVTIDHPYDAIVVEFPDGTLVFAANISSEAQIELDINIRVQDISFVLDQLSLASVVRALSLPDEVRIGTNRVAMYGHSLGGATAASAMLKDHRIVGGVNLDGTFFGSVIDLGVNLPFLLFGHDGKNQSTDASWASIWPNLRSWKLELMLKGAQHATFSDLPILVDALGLGQDLPPNVGALLGTVDGARAIEIITSYLVAFFQFAINGHTSRLLQGPSVTYPEVIFVDQEGKQAKECLV